MREPIPVDLLIAGGTALTMDPDNRLIEGGAVAVNQNTIVAVGPAAELQSIYAPKRVLDATDKAILPGLVDTYGHAGHGLIKGVHHPELAWPSAQLYFHATDEEWWYAEGLLSNLERLRFGVTCGFTVIGATPARLDSPVFAERQALAVSEVGIRGVLGVGPPDPYIDHLPRPWSGTLWENGQPINRPFSYEDTVRNCITVIEGWHHQSNDRIQVALHFPYLFGRQAAHPRIPFVYTDDCVPAMIEKAEEMRDLADRYHVLLHTHAFKGSLVYGLEKFGLERVRRLLAPGVVLAHCNGLAEAEIQILGEAGAGISVVPFTHENILYGPCPVIELLRAGANVTISTDGTAPYCSYDLLKDISRAIWTQWTRFEDQALLPPGKALRMVTIDAARALGLDHLIGSLEVGKRADIILIDLARPHLTPSTNLPWQLVYYANGNDVDTVIVEGRILKEGGRVTSIDERAVIERAREQSARAFKRMDISPYLKLTKNFWQGWRY